MAKLASGWGWRVPVTLDGSAAGLSASTDGILWMAVPATLKAKCQSAGQDLRVTLSDGTLLPHRIRDWSAAAPVIAVRHSAVPTGTATIYLYGGNAGASDGQDNSGLNSGYAAIWPMHDASGGLTDWGPNGYSGTASGSPTYAQTGQVGKCVQFVASTKDYFNVGGVSALSGATYLSVLAWGKLSTAVYLPVVSRFAAFNAEMTHTLYGAYMYHEFKQAPSGIWGSKSGLSNITSWHHYGWRFDGSQSTNSTRSRMWRDGTELSGVSYQGTIPSAVPNTSSANAAIGAYGSLSSIEGYGNGYIDTILVYPGALSDDAFKLAAKSYPGSSLYSVGTLEAAPVTFAGRSLWTPAFSGPWG